MFCPLNYGRFVGAPGESRTPDVLGRNQVLCPLSYRGNCLIVNCRNGVILCNILFCFYNLFDCFLIATGYKRYQQIEQPSGTLSTDLCGDHFIANRYPMSND